MSKTIAWADPTLVIDPAAGDAVELAGARCPACTTTTFPFQTGCPRCGGEAMERIALPSEGTLWSYTVQYFEPKPPFRSVQPFEPYGVGYVDLGDVCVESRLTVNDPDALSLGMVLRLVTITAFLEDDQPVLTFAFAPREDAS
ncbi:MAG: DNA-binding protein [Rhodococcus sp. (in: high G+C Gram-positive bacteria)]|uniref:Zn-ribbon domain-containing OB-fold protein n=1 Tax=Rhodococcus sp. TaxID=1831 RepID=UPI0012053A1B|nr:OB-fold domain-containing protein [Rhodococcus sp. (in: high G+C Gram-positive bacteria)]RZL23108.1 MAG: DNA-binding protein [Rhodococcus sp. (in: high G+C Gram-positive bacteria)]